ncbi:hypothetical protein GCM10015535_46520 [Streptomyces gelaticus]|uniref:Uncharacterized protein n=1 Tax=Streptomyces gelaticus TaxID=285446 RepID=A0ABQ2W5P4_9ACTN|nr:hypothetical protein GCM10015535_46520 [Streptomyces gelaticus]
MRSMQNLPLAPVLRPPSLPFLPAPARNLQVGCRYGGFGTPSVPAQAAGVPDRRFGQDRKDWSALSRVSRIAVEAAAVDEGFFDQPPIRRSQWN